MDNLYNVHAEYLDRIFNNLGQLVDQIANVLKDVEHDTIVGTGLSGTMVVPMLAWVTGKQFAIVRKGEPNHSYIDVEGKIGHKWVFVDDLISTGDTLKRVFYAINDNVAKRNIAYYQDISLYRGPLPQLVAIYEYYDQLLSLPNDYKYDRYVPNPRY